MINIDIVGAQTSISGAGHRIVQLGVYLPGITAADNYQVVARVIHEDDQFDPDVPPRDFPMTWSKPDVYDLWSISIDLTASAGGTANFGRPGPYLYRYQLLKAGQVRVQWFTDPFAREAGEAGLGRFDTEEQPAAWTDAAFKTPALDDLVVYEMHVEQFNDTFDGIITRLNYLKGLGVNCLELMPVTSLKQDFDWGYGPLHFFAPHNRFGNGAQLRRLINACHSQGIAVILDSVYQHVDADFAFHKVYSALGMPSPLILPDPIPPAPPPPYGPECDFTKQFTLDYFRAVNFYWLDNFHVDGFRYDYVPGYYDGDPTKKYGTLVYNVGGGQKQGHFGGLNKATGPVAGCNALRHARGLSSGRRFDSRRWTMRFGLPTLGFCVVGFGRQTRLAARDGVATTKGNGGASTASGRRSPHPFFLEPVFSVMGTVSELAQVRANT